MERSSGSGFIGTRPCTQENLYPLLGRAARAQGAWHARSGDTEEAAAPRPGQGRGMRGQGKQSEAGAK